MLAYFCDLKKIIFLNSNDFLESELHKPSFGYISSTLHGIKEKIKKCRLTVSVLEYFLFLSMSEGCTLVRHAELGYTTYRTGVQLKHHVF